MGDPVGPVGDGWVTLLCPVEGVSLDRGISHEGWKGALAPTLSEFSKGSLTYVERDPIPLGLDATFHDVSALNTSLAQRGTADTKVRAVRLLASADGAFSLRCDLRVIDGWAVDGAMSKVWSRTDRDTTASVVREVLLDTLRPFGDVPQIPYFHAVIGGLADRPEAGRHALRDEVRAFIYPMTASPTVSASPEFTEFVHPGYAFSMLLASRDEELEQRWDSFVQVVQMVQHMYRQAALICDDVESRLDEIDPEEGLVAEREIRRRFMLLRSPTYTYQHRLLVLRDVLVHRWRLEDLVERTEFLIAQLAERRAESELARTKSRQRLLRYGVGLLTALSVVEIVDALLSVGSRI